VPSGRLLRRLRRLLLGRNALRRPSDRIEGAVMVLLSAAFVTACVAAPFLAGHLYQSQHAASAHLWPVVAVLSQTRAGCPRLGGRGAGQVAPA
jgi:hypothetical protein